MRDTENLRPPAVLKEIELDTQALGFTMASDRSTGSLLRTLAASKPAGKFLELGTGTGMSAAWLLDGMDGRSTLLTVDNDESVVAVAKRHLGHDSRITFHRQDGISFIDGLLKQGQTFDFIFADTWPGKFTHLDQTLSMLKIGGLYIIDDMLPQPSWSENHAAKVSRLISTLEQREDLHITKMNWSAGLIVATKKG